MFFTSANSSRTLPASIREQLLLSKYEEMVQKLCKEPKEDMGSCLSKPETLNVDETTNLNERNRKKKNVNKKNSDFNKNFRTKLKKFQ